MLRFMYNIKINTALNYTQNTKICQIFTEKIIPTELIQYFPNLSLHTFAILASFSRPQKYHSEDPADCDNTIYISQ